MEVATVDEALNEYRNALNTESEAEACSKLLAAFDSGAAPLTRDLFDACFHAAAVLKKAAPSPAAPEAIRMARRLIALSERLKELPDPTQRRLRDSQINSYMWALYSLAKHAGDSAAAQKYLKAYALREKRGWQPDEVDRDAYEEIMCLVSPGGQLLAQAHIASDEGNLAESISLYHRACQAAATIPFRACREYVWQICKFLWRDEPPLNHVLVYMLSDSVKLVRMYPEAHLSDSSFAEALHGAFTGFARRLSEMQKQKGGGNAKGILPYDIARDYVALCGYVGFALLTPADFERREVTREQRAEMERKFGYAIYLKEWPSNADLAVTVAARVIKVYSKVPQPIKPFDPMLEFLSKHLDYNEWFAYYYANWLKMLGRYDKAAEYLRATVKRRKNADWAWSAWGDLLRDEPAKARACYCKALTCPSMEREIAETVAMKTHLKLAKAFSALGQGEEAEAEQRFVQMGNAQGNRALYLHYARGVSQMLYEDEQAEEFTGFYETQPGRTYGFVRVHLPEGMVSIFVSPPLARNLTYGQTVRCLAVRKTDMRNNKLGLAAVEILPHEHGEL